MRFVSVRDLRGKSGEVWKDLPEEREMVITSNGRPVAILAAVNESTLEESLAAFRKARAVDAVAKLQRESVSRGTDKPTEKEIDAEIADVRSKRKERGSSSTRTCWSPGCSRPSVRIAAKDDSGPARRRSRS